MRPISAKISLLAALCLAAFACDSGTTTFGSDTISGGDATVTKVPTSFGPVDLVTARKYDALLVEIDYVAGHAPNPAALSQLEEQLNTLRKDGHLAKSGGIRFVLDESLDPVGADHVSTFDELSDRAKAHRSILPRVGEATIHVLYTDGKYQDDGDQTYVLGFAYGGSWLVMLADNIERGCQSSPLLGLPAFSGLAAQACARGESTVFLHELGHLFGLVDNGTPMVKAHEDPDHGGHDSNTECLMYWAIEGSRAFDVIAERFQKGKSGAVPFDAACLADLDALIAGN
ncbi:MAG: hypothetical protein R3F39_11550 [Myxococcota bacterium]